MNKRSSTKKALTASIMSMALCTVLLIGTTFAWFTDSVSSGTNVIKAGNLDVKLEYSEDGTDWKNAAGATDLFDSSVNWEPGHVEVVYLKVSNAGDLALKYKLGVNVLNTVIGKTADGQDIDLSDFLKFGIAEPDTAYADRPAALAAVTGSAASVSQGYTSEEKTLAAGASSNMIAMVVYMPEDVSNDANHNGTDVPSIEMGVKLAETQATAESDSFGTDYDAGAAVPSILDGSQSTVNDLSGNIIVTAENNTLTFGNNGTIGEKTAVDMNNTAQNIKESIKAGNGQSLTMINGELVKSTTFGKVRFDTKGKEQVGLFENMTFTDKLAPTHRGSSSNDTEEMIQLCPNGGGSGTYIFRNCTFNNACVTVNGMNDGAPINLVFENCTFNNTGNADAIEINPSYITGGSVTIKDCTFNLVTTSNICAVDMSGTSRLSLKFEGANRVNGTVADSSIYNLYSSTSVKAYNAGNVTGADTITVTGIATEK